MGWPHAWPVPDPKPGRALLPSLGAVKVSQPHTAVRAIKGDRAPERDRSCAASHVSTVWRRAGSGEMTPLPAAAGTRRAAPFPLQ